MLWARGPRAGIDPGHQSPASSTKVNRATHWRHGGSCQGSITIQKEMGGLYAHLRTRLQGAGWRRPSFSLLRPLISFATTATNERYKSKIRTAT